MDDPIPCILCDIAAGWRNADGVQATCVCDRCGEYDVGLPIRLGLRTREARAQIPDRHLISGYTREQYDKWKRNPSNTVEAPAFVDSKDFARIASLAPRRIPERGLKLLQAIERRTEFYGQTVILLVTTDWPLGYAKNEDEFLNLIDYLGSHGWVKIIAKFPKKGAAGCESLDLWLTADGYSEIEGRRISNLESDRAFVAMSFDPTLLSQYVHGIKPAIEESGFAPIRIDATDYNGDVVDQIIVEIRKSRFVIADTTGHRGGVYFEAGFALGLGLEVIFSCKDGDFAQSHFDVNHMNHIVWTTAEDLRTQLARRIQATIGFGPLEREGRA